MILRNYCEFPWLWHRLVGTFSKFSTFRNMLRLLSDGFKVMEKEFEKKKKHLVFLYRGWSPGSFTSVSIYKKLTALGRWRQKDQ